MESRLSTYRFLKVRGHRIAYRTCGREDGAPIMLIHAFASQSDSWKDTASALAHAGFRVIAPDLRGHGRSERTSTYALMDFEQDLIALLDALNLSQLSLVGHSLGGHLALKLATHQPERIRRVVVEATPVPPQDAADAAAIASAQPGPAWRRSLQLVGLGRLLRLVFLRRFDLRATRSVLPELRVPMPDWWSRLATLQTPCLLLAGHDDGLVTKRLPLLAARLPQATARSLGVGHRLHSEHTEAFLAEVLPFLGAADHAN
ncbi:MULTISPECIES: alpha/beta hydrolase [unclassified Dyella]|uniref:alpha/beta fold hydrolase n=1 Tax=unclassified Dyella TaxID=2634549 RepID=UPI000CBBB17C|nr:MULTISPECIES: alpha/beta hydrolase [unclassified Dyella]MDR3447097.1 alpha/beta hydrolase [Dyella sp.]PMQ04844.1 2-hydroxymuconate semialdehyde hydrolase [Dyella sp. AD56]